jgi:two-component system response regulator FixJ
MNQNHDPTVFIVEDELAIGKILLHLFESVQLHAELFSDGQVFLEKYDANRRGCILTDIRMPRLSGLELQEQLVLRDNLLPIVFMSGHGDISMAVRAMKSGAFDFITKPFHNQTLLDIVQKAIQLNMTEKSQENSVLIDDIHHRFAQLTPRENEVLKLITEGKLNKQIAYMLSISISTVEMHRANIMKKMKVKTLADLIKLSIKFESVR